MGKPALRPKTDLFPYALVSPAMIVTIAIIFIPMLRTVSYSFMNYILYKPDEKAFNGLANYIQAFKDPVFWSSFLHTILWIIGIVGFQFLLGLVTALLLNKTFPCRGIARSLILIPWVTPSVITALMWRWMYDGNYGIINQLLVQAGLIKRFIPWLANSSTALTAIIIALVWQGFPFFAIMLLAGLQAIPQEMYEASAIDGAGTWQNFMMITLPFLRPVIFTTILLRTIWVANSLDVIIVMTGGGPGYSTYTLPVYSYVKAYKGMDFGYSSALAVLLTIFIMIFVSGYIKKIFNAKDQ